MENFEFFGASDKKEGLSPEALEAFQEKMKKAAKEMSAAKKEEKKHKKKEEDLYKILLDFIKNSKNDKLVSLLTETLELNIPSGFLLAIIQLGNEQITEILGTKQSDTNSLTFFNEEDSLSPVMKMEMDLWVKSQIEYSKEKPEKIYKTSLDTKNPLNPIIKPLKDLHEYTIYEYLRKHSVNLSTEKLSEFSIFILTGIISRLKPAELNGVS